MNPKHRPATTRPVPKKKTLDTVFGITTAITGWLVLLFVDPGISQLTVLGFWRLVSHFDFPAGGIASRNP